MVMGKNILLLILLTLMASVSFAKVTARADRLEIYDDETFILTVSVSPSGKLSPTDISALESIFTIVARGQSTQSSSMNGQRTSVAEYQFRLAPKEVGLLGLPTFTVNNEQSDTFFINVKDSKTRTHNLDPDAILYNIDVSDKTPYIDQSITLTIEIAYRIALSGQFAHFNFPGFESGDDAEQHSVETRQGKSYNVYRRIIKLTPRQAGEFSLPEIEFLGQYQVSSARPAKRINLNAKPPKITVRPIPADYPAGAYWLPAVNLEIKDNLEQSISLEPNEHLSWSITQEVTGLNANLLPDPLTSIEGDSQFKLYRDKPVFNSEGGTATRKDITALSINNSGASNIELPEIRIPWWNITTDTLEYAMLPSRTITIKEHVQVLNKNQTIKPQTGEIKHYETSLLWSVITAFLMVVATSSLFINYKLYCLLKSKKHSTHNLNRRKKTDQIKSLGESYTALLALTRQHNCSIESLKGNLSSTSKLALESMEQSYFGQKNSPVCTITQAKGVLQEAHQLFNQVAQSDKSKLKVYPEE